MSNCEYVREHYGVPAETGRRVNVKGKLGIIAEDRGHYIGVNFDCDAPGVVYNVHPTDHVEYLGISTLRSIKKLTRGQQRYQEYLEFSDCYDSFADFLGIKKGSE